MDILLGPINVLVFITFKYEKGNRRIRETWISD